MTFIALLRAVNVTGYNAVNMTDLRGMAEALGLTAVRTLLQSGNLVFEATRQPTQALERRLEAECKARLGVATDVFVRTADEWRAAIEANPFADDASRDPKHLVLMCLKDAPEPARLNALRAAIKDRERVALAGRHAYVVYPDGIGRSRLTNTAIEKLLGSRGTARNWNTVQKLATAAL